MKSRRRIAFLEAYADFQLQQGFAIDEMGSGRHFAQQQSSRPNVRFGSKADIRSEKRVVRFTPGKQTFKGVNDIKRVNDMSALCQKQTLAVQRQ
jgi:hypothetical protein